MWHLIGKHIESRIGRSGDGVRGLDAECRLTFASSDPNVVDPATTGAMNEVITRDQFIAAALAQVHSATLDQMPEAVAVRELKAQLASLERIEREAAVASAQADLAAESETLGTLRGTPLAKKLNSLKAAKADAAAKATEARQAVSLLQSRLEAAEAALAEHLDGISSAALQLCRARMACSESNIFAQITHQISGLLDELTRIEQRRSYLPSPGRRIGWLKAAVEQQTTAPAPIAEEVLV